MTTLLLLLAVPLSVWAALLLLLLPRYTWAAPRSGPVTYVVAITGSDTSPCSEAAPCATFAHALAKMQGGDTLMIRAGTYAQSIDTASMPLPSGTSWESATTIKAAPGETVTLKPGSLVVSGYGSQTYAYVIFRGFILDGAGTGHTGIYISGPQAHHIRVEDTEVHHFMHMGVQGYDTAFVEYLRLKVHHNGTDRLMHGIYIAYQHGLIDGCDVYENAGYGIQVYNSACTTDQCASDTTIRNSRVHHNHGDGGVTLNYGARILFYNNLVYANRGDGVALAYGHPTDAVLVHNTLTGNGGTALSIGDQATGTLVRNTIAWSNGAAFRDLGTATVQDHNLTTDPRFISETDFHLQAGSPAVDTGAVLLALTRDFDGVVRPQGAGYDLGAFERVVDTPVPPEPGPSPVALTCTGDLLAQGKIALECLPHGRR